ncbi:MAG: hypothetical protein B7Y56_13380 [Gallionellales bacterium 35-53-114]|jgi:hypothetical protein|nr:MAG: hypothetical protein B7Y56_13380 [Gallionellales bacterium 35-53-114]OYZ63072.1 MAG: hypothetical protein B7Y04_11435 [Gallionellales bacterium 24-53-125]OZB08947.1 MAG: hypothetical protein B7X61_08165 [Gallionellales bacterium 39-52-133]HQS59380.1 DUF5677 domain-containing protein [Gallionellaceae bacterium]HQS76293.1 DUF5677 domain-containing protein [Gallionellaceae bacterium]
MSDLQELIKDFDFITEIAYDLSQQFDGVQTDDRKRKISTYYLAKIVPECISLLMLLPGSRFTGSGVPFDFPSFCSISRNLIEAANLHWYYCIENTNTEISNFRFYLYDYHDHKSTIQIGKFIGGEERDLSSLQKKCDDLKTIIMESPIFNSLLPEIQKQILKGRKCSDQNQTEISENRGLVVSTFNGVYKILSTNVHSTPSAINALVHSKIHGKELDEAFAGLVLSYVASFIADMVRTIGEIWCLEFTKRKSAETIRLYSEALSEST